MGRITGVLKKISQNIIVLILIFGSVEAYKYISDTAGRRLTLTTTIGKCELNGFVGSISTNGPINFLKAGKIINGSDMVVSLNGNNYQLSDGELEIRYERGGMVDFGRPVPLTITGEFSKVIVEKSEVFKVLGKGFYRVSVDGNEERLLAIIDDSVELSIPGGEVYIRDRHVAANSIKICPKYRQAILIANGESFSLSPNNNYALAEIIGTTSNLSILSGGDGLLKLSKSDDMKVLSKAELLISSSSRAIEPTITLDEKQASVEIKGVVHKVSLDNKTIFSTNLADWVVSNNYDLIKDFIEIVLRK